ncbi:MAG: transferase [Colwellia sp.]|nr:transferase [Colwellia sp.]
MTFSFKNKLGHRVLSVIQNYNHQKYWRRRATVVNPNSKTNLLIKLYYLYYIKKTDAFHNCSFGTNLGSGTTFEEPPHLPHGPKGIIIGHDLKIGKGVVLYHNVTLAHGGSVIGDNVLFSTGSVLLSGKNIGGNVKIGANAVVVEDIPCDSTVVLSKPRVIVNIKKIN